MNIGALVKKIRDNSVLRVLTYPIARMCYFLLAKYAERHPVSYPSHNHKWKYGRPLDLENPRSLHEKIYWMLYNTDTSMWTRLTDKVAVRDYVKQLGLEHILNEVYSVYDYIPDIQTLFQNLPNSFVIKTSHSGGGHGVFVVPNANAIDKDRIYHKLKKAFRDEYGKRTGQPHYEMIKPRIIVEKYLVNDIDENLTLPDYKFFCFHGEPQLILCVANRNIEKHTYCLHYYTLDWQRIHWDKKDLGPDLVPPKSLDEMIVIAKKLSQPFAFVRVDLYEVGGKPIFGEMTFTPGFDGLLGTYGENVLGLGSRIDLSKVDMEPKTSC